jgi:hypothetical protein
MTGDIFSDVTLYDSKGEAVRRKKTALVLQHPCAIREDGVRLVESVLIAEVRRHRELAPEEWQGFWKVMPLPEMFADLTSGDRNQAAFFDQIYLAHRDQLTNRVACLSLFGINVMLQRWIHHNSRFLVPTSELNKVVVAAYEEVDLIEDWCMTALGGGHLLEEAEHDVDEWLNEDAGGLSRRKYLEDGQRRTELRREARRVAVAKYSSARTAKSD